MQPPPLTGRDPADDRTIDLESWLIEQRSRRADRIRSDEPELSMAQLPLDLHERGTRAAPGW